MATNQTTQTGNTWQQNLQNALNPQTNWQRHLYMANLANQSNPQTMAGYFLGSLFRDKFHDLMDNMFGTYKDGQNGNNPNELESNSTGNMNYAKNFFNNGFKLGG